MDFVIAIGDARRFQQVRAAIDSKFPLELRFGGLAETATGCDVALVNFPLSCERYGADPARHVAQVLVNDRGDGAPPVIVAVPPREIDAEGNLIAEEVGYGEWVEWAVRTSLNALVTELGELPQISILIHLEAAALDERPLEALAVLLGMRTDWRGAGDG